MFDERLRELARARALHVVASALLLAPVWVVTWPLAWLLLPGPAWAWATGASLLLFAIGYFKNVSGKADEWRSYQAPFEPNTVSGYAVNREITKVTGIAFLIDELVMGSSAQLVKAIEKSHIIRALRAANRQECAELVSTLQALGTSPRFHSLATVEASTDVLPPLSAADIVWIKPEEGTIGLNRRYDNATP